MATAEILVSGKGQSTEPTEPGSPSDCPFPLGFLAFSYQDQHRSEDRSLLLPRLPVDSQVGLLPVVREMVGGGI